MTKNGCDAHWLKIQGMGSSDFSKIPGGRGFPDKIARGFPVLGWNLNCIFINKVFICLWGVLCYTPFPQIHRVHLCCKGFKNTKHIFRHLLFHSLIIQLNMIRKLGIFPRQRTRRRTWTRSWRHLDRLMFRALVRLKSAKQ